MKDDQFYNSEEEKENSSSDANLALVIIICGVIAASLYVSSL
jgi:hypothetical protein|tara:strand:- start:521 stop:646 length:126 start_codon:yes stop_codon:yes gene_type:complete